MQHKSHNQHQVPPTAWILQGPDPEADYAVRPVAIYTTLAGAQQGRRETQMPDAYDIITAPLIDNPQRQQHHTVSFVRTDGPDGPSVTQRIDDTMASFEQAFGFGPQDRVSHPQPAKTDSQEDRRAARDTTSGAPYMSNTAYASGDGASASIYVNQESSFLAEMRRTYPHAFPDQNQQQRRPSSGAKTAPGPTTARNSMYDNVAQQQQQTTSEAKRQAAKEHALALLDQLNKECQRIAGNSAASNDTDRSL